MELAHHEPTRVNDNDPDNALAGQTGRDYSLQKC